MEQGESRIAEWRAFLAQRPAVDGRDVEELEAHLCDQITDLESAGLDADEAFLVAVKRMGRLDELSREFAREHSGRLWRQLVVAGDDGLATTERRWPEMVAFAVAAAVAVQVARLVAGFPDEDAWWLFRNASLFVLPFLAGWFVRRRGLSPRQAALAAAPFVVAALVTNLYPYGERSSTQILAMVHLPVALWLVVAYPYTAGVVHSHEQRMDFVRFTGEWSIYYVLIALGGGVLTGLTAGILEPTGMDTERVFEWVLPTGAAGAVIVAAWLVESKQRIVENMAPVLTMLAEWDVATCPGATPVEPDARVATAQRKWYNMWDGPMEVPMPLTLPSSPSGVHEFRQNLTQLLKRVRREGDFPVQFVGAYRRIEGVFMSPRRYEQLLEAENLVEDIGLAELVAERDDGRFYEGTTDDFLAEVEQRTT